MGHSLVGTLAVSFPMANSHCTYNHRLNAPLGNEFYKQVGQTDRPPEYKAGSHLRVSVMYTFFWYWFPQIRENVF